MDAVVKIKGLFMTGKVGSLIGLAYLVQTALTLPQWGMLRVISCMLLIAGF